MGPIASNGILSFTSYKTDFGGFELNPKAIVLDYEGMQLQRQLYSPGYENEVQQKSRIPDFRSLLYWSPEVNTDMAGRAQVSFYTSDKSGKYIAVMQGIKNNSQAASQCVMFEGKKYFAK